MVVHIDWGAGNHENERRLFIEALQRFAKHRSIRVTFIAGDVSFVSPPTALL